MSGRRNIQLAPSLLAADFADLSGAVKLLDDVVGIFHIDIMDGHFVPNITIGVPVVRSMKGVASRPLDVHLMIEHPDQFVEAFVEAGASMVSVHVEATHHLQRTLSDRPDAEENRQSRGWTHDAMCSTTAISAACPSTAASPRAGFTTCDWSSARVRKFE